jgi:Cu+-exporting ATPase
MDERIESSAAAGRESLLSNFGGARVLGLAAALGLLAVYFGLLTLVSGWSFTVEQFASFWPYIVALAAGFGIQIALYGYLRRLVRGSAAHGKVVAASGATSTAAMVSCCAHYLANLLPIVGATGLVALAAQYQVEFFWVGLAFNAAGIIYITTRVAAAAKEHARCVVPA